LDNPAMADTETKFADFHQNASRLRSNNPKRRRRFALSAHSKLQCDKLIGTESEQIS
jgi:hypothetical protein